MNKKNIIIAVLVVLVAAAAVTIGVSKKKTTTNDVVNTETQSNETQTGEDTKDGNEISADGASTAQNTNAEDSTVAQNQVKGTDDKDEAVYTPTFMYFISSADPNFEEAKKVAEELEKEYKGKVNFDVRNITEDPETGKNFSAEGQTPMLIMLNKKNDLSTWLPLCSDKEELKKAIDSALE